jgi:transposase-like protein
VKRYSAERKESILRRMMPPENKLISELARENGITEQTLYTWRRNLKSQGVPVPGNGKSAEEWSSKDKFSVVLETAQLNEAELVESSMLTTTATIEVCEKTSDFHRNQVHRTDFGYACMSPCLLNLKKAP